MRAGFAQVDITPPPGTEKIGWLRSVVGNSAADPIYARAAVFEADGRHIAFVQLDTLSVRWTTAEQIRALAVDKLGLCPDCIMVAATHTHAGPAVANCGEVRRDEAYLEALRQGALDALSEAVGGLQEAQTGIGSCAEFEVSCNRRVVMRDGTVCTHGHFGNPDSLFLEGPIDPEVAVVAARDAGGRLLGAMVNFACHPTHMGTGDEFSAGYPGVLAQTMAERGCPVTLFLNGAAGNLHTSDPRFPDLGRSMEQAGTRLAEDACRIIDGMQWRDDVRLSSRRKSIELPYRRVTPEEIAGTVRGAQRFVDSGIYDRGMEALVERIRTRKTQPAEVQALSIDEYSFASVPAEYFAELGLRIKEESYPRHALVVAWANGMIGYVPHAAAFKRGGYETTFAATSRMAPEAGDMLADLAIDLIRQEGAN